MAHAASAKLIRLACRATFALLVLLPCLWIPISLLLPLGRDQGIFAWTGQVVLAGGLPYVDAWEVKGPLVPALYASALALFGKFEMAVRIFDSLMLAGMLAAYLRLGKLWESRLSGWLAFGAAFFLLGASFWERAQPDGWVAILLLWMTALVLPADRRLRSLVAAGILLGMTALVKPIFLLFGGVLLVRELYGREPGSLRRIATFLLAAAVPIVAVAALYAWRGELGTLVEVYLVYNLRSPAGQHGAMSVAAWFQTLFRLLFGLPNFSATVLAVVGGARLWKRNRQWAVVLATGAAIGLVAVILQNKWYPYHFLPYQSFLAALAGYGLASIYSWACEESTSVSTPKSRKTAWLALPLLLLACVPISKGLIDSARLWKDALWPRSADSWQRNFITSDFSHSDIADAAAFVRDHSKPDDKIYLWGYDALLYFLADRSAATRFGFNYCLVAGPHEYIARYRRELMRNLHRDPPTVIVVQKGDANNLMPKSSDQYLADFPPLAQLIEDRYALSFENDSFLVYLAK